MVGNEKNIYIFVPVIKENIWLNMIFKIIRTHLLCVFSSPKKFTVYDIYSFFFPMDSFNRHLFNIYVSLPQPLPSWSSRRENRYVNTWLLQRVINAVKKIALDTVLAQKNTVSSRCFSSNLKYIEVHQEDRKLTDFLSRGNKGDRGSGA